MGSIRQRNLTLIRKKAAAKINLGLKVHFRRDDGYHEIETLMQSISLGDHLLFELRSDGKVTLQTHGADIPVEENLVYRVALRLKEEDRKGASEKGVNITLCKIIPAGAGLAGGSSDAAVTLQALNDLWDMRIPPGRLEEIGAELGSDIPFCLRGGTVMAKGRGEELVSWPEAPFMGVVLAKPPGLAVSTPEIYGALPNCIPQVNLRYNVLHEALISKKREAVISWSALPHLNTLELVAEKRYPAIGELKEKFKLIGLYPIMSGSGPTVFALTSNLNKAREGVGALEELGYPAWLSWIE